MNLLVDTQLLLWCAATPDKLSRKARTLLEDPENRLFFSAASLWELTIKNSLGRQDFHADTRLLRRGLLDNGWRELPVSSQHVLALEHLPLLHKDPFDRILLAQAEAEGFTFLTSDTLLQKYPVPVQGV